MMTRHPVKNYDFWLRLKGALKAWENLQQEILEESEDSAEDDREIMVPEVRKKMEENSEAKNAAIRRGLYQRAGEAYFLRPT